MKFLWLGPNFIISLLSVKSRSYLEVSEMWAANQAYKSVFKNRGWWWIDRPTGSCQIEDLRLYTLKIQKSFKIILVFSKDLRDSKDLTRFPHDYSSLFAAISHRKWNEHNDASDWLPRGPDVVLLLTKYQFADSTCVLNVFPPQKILT